jgi:plastocyanin
VCHIDDRSVVPVLRRFSFLIGLVVLACVGVLVAGCGSSGGTAAATSTTAAAPNTITIDNFAFAPKSMTVSPGATVTVKNNDSTAHTLTANNKSFDTGGINAGGSKTFTAPTKPGTYAYICTIHPFMKGTLVVKAESAGASRIGSMPSIRCTAASRPRVR